MTVREIRTPNQLPPAPTTDAARDLALAETQLTLLRALQVLHGAQNLPGMTLEQLTHDLSWRVGYATARLDQLQERLKMLIGPRKAEPEQGSTPNA